MKPIFKIILMCSLPFLIWSGMCYVMYIESMKEANPVIPLTVSLIIYAAGLYFIVKDMLSEDTQLNKQEVKTNGNN